MSGRDSNTNRKSSGNTADYPRESSGTKILGIHGRRLSKQRRRKQKRLTLAPSNPASLLYSQEIEEQ